MWNDTCRLKDVEIPALKRTISSAEEERDALITEVEDVSTFFIWQAVVC
jgi:hypothetical protein